MKFTVVTAHGNIIEGEVSNAGSEIVNPITITDLASGNFASIQEGPLSPWFIDSSLLGGFGCDTKCVPVYRVMC